MNVFFLHGLIIYIYNNYLSCNMKHLSVQSVFFSDEPGNKNQTKDDIMKQNQKEKAKRPTSSLTVSIYVFYTKK